jgi:hypothetical protein
MFPQSADGFQQEVVLFKDSLNTSGQHVVANLLYGYVDYSAGLIYIFPLSSLASGILTEQTVLKLTGQFNSSGATTVSPQDTRSGSYAIQGTAGTTFTASGAPTTGTFIVYRG